MDGDHVNVQAEYDADPALQPLLSRGAESPAVPRDRADGVDDAHRDRVHQSTDRALTEHATLLQRLREEDAGGDDDATTE